MASLFATVQSMTDQSDEFEMWEQLITDICAEAETIRVYIDALKKAEY
jgi:hypothetical protein